MQKKPGKSLPLNKAALATGLVLAISLDYTASCLMGLLPKAPVCYLARGALNGVELVLANTVKVLP